MHNEIILPIGAYQRKINGKEKTFLIFKYTIYGVQYTNYSKELPKDVKPNEVFAVNDGSIDLELIVNKDIPF